MLNIVVMRTINGQILKDILISGSNNLYNHYAEVDALNVFPVPDGDTGMNMNLTCTSGANEIKKLNTENIYEVAKTFARGLLMGARGNSGVITSQIFRGFADALEGKESINVEEFANAWTNGVKVAYKAVTRPVEGTILTVVRESALALHERIHSVNSFEKVFDILISEGQDSLKRTPELLPILKEVGVVDSGGTGLVYIYKGMKEGLEGHIVERNSASDQTDNPIAAAGSLMESEEFGYCTEFIMSLGPDTVKKIFNEKKFTETLSKNGTSLVVVHDDDIVKVHVHTMTPGNILNYAQQFGEFLKIKIENMTEQHHALETGATVEQHEDLVEEEPKEKQKYALIGVSSGDGIDEYFKEVGFSYIVKGGQTMNPSSEDFVEAIKKANAETVFIFPNNSNIVMAASQACDMLSEEGYNAYVIPSKTITQGVASAIMFNPDGSPEENFRELKSALKNIKSGEVTFSIRDCEINGVKVNKDDFIGIFEKDIVVGTKDKNECILALIDKMIDEESSVITLIYGEDVSDEEALKLKKAIEGKYPDLDIDLRSGKQPVYSYLVGVE